MLMWPWSGQCCTIQYAPPEVVHSGPAGCPADVWSLGAIAFEFVDGRRLVQYSDRDMVVKELKDIPKRIEELPRSGEDCEYMKDRM